MKLRNKKTGAVKEFSYVGAWDGKIVDDYDTLAELNEEWEDCEKPKSFWTINTTFDCAEPIVSVIEINERYYDDKDAKSIGNYFETKEEAEKAVEKLKAWKRLKDKGFKIDFVISLDDGGYGYFEANWWTLKGDFTDLKTIFWGEQ